MSNPFAARNRVAEYRWGRRNLYRILALTGSPRPEVLRVLNLGLDRWGDPRVGCFDHVRIYGRGGRPLLMVASPYGIEPRDRAWFAHLAELGAVVRILPPHRSAYGFGTHQIEISTPGALERIGPLWRPTPDPATLPATLTRK